VKHSQNPRLVSSDHGPTTSNSTTCSAIACSTRFTDVRTVTDGTDTKIDRHAVARARAPALWWDKIAGMSYFHRTRGHMWTESKRWDDSGEQG
jgi:hypothetical protein